VTSGVSGCGTVRTSAAPRPATIIAQVTASALMRVGSSIRVTRIETCRMYSRPAQCSPLTRPITAWGWQTAWSSARVGVEVIGPPQTQARPDTTPM
jgi:hypothetical protein